jgi:mono/diheme cytochrome c family protein
MGAAFVLAVFIALGLGTVFIAMSGGPSRAREALRNPSSHRPRRGAGLTMGIVVAVFGVGLPAFVMLNNSDDQAAAGPGGTTLTASQKEGREVFARYCATCHTLTDARAVGKVGPDLDVLRPQAGLTVNAIQQGRARGQGQMPAQLLDDQDARKVAAYVAKVAGR